MYVPTSFADSVHATQNSATNPHSSVQGTRIISETMLVVGTSCQLLPQADLSSQMNG